MLERLDIARAGAFIAALAVALSLAVSGCGADGMGALSGGDESGFYRDPQMRQALADLGEHRVDSARERYDDLIDQGAAPPEAYAGRALTNLLLLPGADSVTEIATSHLGAEEGIDANDAIYAEEGYFYWLVSGVSWEDDGEYSGIGSLIADRLPWSAEELTTLEAFLGEREAAAGDVAADLVEVADELADVERDLQAAIDARDLDVFYLPGRVFHDDDLDAMFARAELHQLAALVEVARGALYMIAAYEHDWTLAEAFGPAAESEDEEGDGGAGEEESALDRAIAFIDPRLGRTVAEPIHLEEAREAFAGGLEHFAAAIEAGVDEPGGATLPWRSADQEHASRLASFVEALSRSLYEPTELPHTAPETTADFSSLFESGRTLDEGVDWFEREEAEGEEGQWRLTDEALQAFLVNNSFEPAFEVGQNTPDWPIESERLDAFYRDVFGDVVNTVENSFLSTR